MHLGSILSEGRVRLKVTLQWSSTNMGSPNRFWIYRYASRVCSEAKTTELLQEVSHRKWRDFALCRLLSSVFLGNTFSSNPVDLLQFMHNSLYLVTKFVKPYLEPLIRSSGELTDWKRAWAAGDSIDVFTLEIGHSRRLTPAPRSTPWESSASKETFGGGGLILCSAKVESGNLKEHKPSQRVTTVLC